MKKLVHNLGFNTNKYPAEANNISQNEYNTWQRMLERCTAKCWVRQPFYNGTTCSDNFKSYTFFYEWCNAQVGFGNVDSNNKYWHLDKDLLVKGNRIYSEDTCVFIPQKINNLLTKSDSSRGKYPIGVTWHKVRLKFCTVCSDGHGKQKHLGYSDTPEEAFLIYKKFKENLIKQVANEYEQQIDTRAYNALMNYEVNIND